MSWTACGAVEPATSTEYTGDDPGEDGPEEPPAAFDPPATTVAVRTSTSDPGFETADVSDPNNLSQEAVQPGTDRSSCPALIEDGSVAAIGSFDGGGTIRGYDISDPANPVLLWTIDPVLDDLGANDAIVEGAQPFYDSINNRLIVGVWSLSSTVNPGAHLMVYDWPDPTSAPTFLSSLKVHDNTRVVAPVMLGDGETVFLGAPVDFSSGDRSALRSFSVSADGLTINPLDSIQLPTPLHNTGRATIVDPSPDETKIAVTQSRNWVLTIIDVSDPSALVILGNADESGGLTSSGGFTAPQWGVGPTSERVYVHHPHGGPAGETAVRAYDVSTPSNPTEIGNFITGGLSTATRYALAVQPDGEVGLFSVPGVQITSIDLTDEVGFAVLDTADVSISNPEDVGIPFGPTATKPLPQDTQWVEV